MVSRSCVLAVVRSNDVDGGGPRVSDAVAIMLVLAASAAGGALSLLAQSGVRVAHRKAHQEFGAVVFLQLGVVFAVLLAFVFNSCWDGYNDAAQSIDGECSALHGAGMIASGLPKEQARRVLSLETAYVKSVLDAEWAVMARRRAADPGTVDELVRLVRAVAGLQTRDRDQIQQLLQQAHAQREERIFQARLGVPAALWTVLVVFETVLVLFVSLSAIESKWIAVAFTATFAAGTTSILVLARMLDFPFEGGLALPSSDFLGLLGRLASLPQGM